MELEMTVEEHGAEEEAKVYEAAAGMLPRWALSAPSWD